MAFWVWPMQVWAKRPPLSPKDKKLWPCIPLPRIHGREIRDRACLVHRHRRLLETPDQRAERADSKVKTDRPRNGAIPCGRSGRKAIAIADWRWRRPRFSHECGSASFVRAGNYEGIAKTSGIKREA